MEVLALWGRHLNHRGLRNHWKYNQPLGSLQKVSLFFPKGEQCAKLQAWCNQMGVLGDAKECTNLRKRRADSLKQLFFLQRDADPVQKTNVISQGDAHPVQIINNFPPERCTVCSTTCWPPCASPTCSSSAATSPSPQSPLANPKFSTLVNPHKYLKIHDIQIQSSP